MCSVNKVVLSGGDNAFRQYGSDIDIGGEEHAAEGLALPLKITCPLYFWQSHLVLLLVHHSQRVVYFFSTGALDSLFPELRMCPPNGLLPFAGDFLLFRLARGLVWVVRIVALYGC